MIGASRSRRLQPAQPRPRLRQVLVDVVDRPAGAAGARDLSVAEAADQQRQILALAGWERRQASPAPACASIISSSGVAAPEQILPAAVAGQILEPRLTPILTRQPVDLMDRDGAQPAEQRRRPLRLSRSSVTHAAWHASSTRSAGALTTRADRANQRAVVAPEQLLLVAERGPTHAGSTDSSSYMLIHIDSN